MRGCVLWHLCPGAALWVLIIQAVSKMPCEGEAGCGSRCGPCLGMVPPWEGSWGLELRADGALHPFISSQSCESACVRVLKWNVATLAACGCPVSAPRLP